MNEDITLVHNSGYKLSRQHANAAAGKVDIVNWDNQGNPEALKRMNNVQGAYGGFHTFPCYIYRMPDAIFKKVLVDTNFQELDCHETSIQGGLKKDFHWPDFQSFYDYYNEVTKTKAFTDKWMKFVFPEVKVDVKLVDDEGNIVDTDVGTINEEVIEKRLYGESNHNSVIEEMAQYAELRKAPQTMLIAEEPEPESEIEVIDI